VRVEQHAWIILLSYGALYHGEVIAWLFNTRLRIDTRFIRR